LCWDVSGLYGKNSLYKFEIRSTKFEAMTKNIDIQNGMFQIDGFRHSGIYICFGF